MVIVKMGISDCGGFTLTLDATAMKRLRLANNENLDIENVGGAHRVTGDLFHLGIAIAKAYEGDHLGDCPLCPCHGSIGTAVVETWRCDVCGSLGCESGAIERFKKWAPPGKGVGRC